MVNAVAALERDLYATLTIFDTKRLLDLGIIVVVRSIVMAITNSPDTDQTLMTAALGHPKAD